MSDSKALATKDPFLQLLARKRGRLEGILPAGVRVEKIMNIVAEIYARDENIRKCRPASIMNSVIQSAILGLELNTPLGLASLIPYGGECTLQIEYKGLIQLILETGKVTDIDANTVRLGDDFEYELGTSKFLRHRPAPESERGELTHAYAIAEIPVFSPRGDKLLASQKKFVVLDRSDIDQIKKHSAAAQKGRSSPWQTDEDQMWMKSAIKRLSKTLPKNIKAARALDIDNQGETGEPQKWDIEVEAEDVTSQEMQNANTQQKSEDRQPELQQKMTNARAATQRARAAAPSAPIPVQEQPAPQASATTPQEPPVQEETQMTDELFNSTFNRYWNKDSDTVRAVLKEQGYKDENDLPDGVFGRCELLAAIFTALAQK